MLQKRSKMQQCLTNLAHSSKVRGFCLMKWPSKMLQIFPYFWNMKTHVVFSFRVYFFLRYVRECLYRPGHSLGKKIK